MPDSSKFHAFETLDDLNEWMRENHDDADELWVRIYKKGSGTQSVIWTDCVVVGIMWGWIDSQKKSLDDESYLQRMTPRRAKSNWSKKNVEHAERLLAEGRLQPSGLVHIEAARADGRWENAYAGSADMTIPDDFLLELRQNEAARAFYETLNRANLFAIYHRIATAKRPATRANRIAAIIARLERGEAFH